MKNKTILKRAINKAVKKGYRSEWFRGDGVWRVGEVYGDAYDHYEDGIGRFIFSHDFAKAFWGTEDVDRMTVASTRVANDLIKKYGKAVKWAYHLQQMVLEKDPIKYLEKYL